MTTLIQGYDLEIFTPPCDPGTEHFAAVAHLEADIRPVLPLLNARLTGAVFHPRVPALTWKKGGLHVSFHATEIAVANVEDRDQAMTELDELVELVNQTWSQREAITPDYESHQRPVPMDIYKLLPRGNCRRCGEPTCFTFALKLAAGQRQPEDCPVLLESAYQTNLFEIKSAVLSVPAVGSGDESHP